MAFRTLPDISQACYKSGMSSNDLDRCEVRERMASAEAELDRHRRVTRITLLVLTILFALGLGVLLANFAGSPSGRVPDRALFTR